MRGVFSITFSWVFAAVHTAAIDIDLYLVISSWVCAAVYTYRSAAAQLSSQQSLRFTITFETLKHRARLGDTQACVPGFALGAFLGYASIYSL